MPAGAAGGPYAVTVDARGRVWANEIETDTVAMFDPASGKFQVFKLPSKGVGIRKAIIDKNVRIGKNVKILNRNNIENFDAPDRSYYIRDGIVIVPKNSLIHDDTEI